mgnify:CR=1 FL=1
MNVFFDVQEIYYLPQYLPVCKELSERGIESTFVLYGFNRGQLGSCILPEGSCVEVVDGEQEARAFYIRERPDWLIIGNNLDGLDDIHRYTRTALVSHGIGPKACYYDVSDSATSVRFVEGPYRTKRLQDMYPDQIFVDTGYAKLDPIINGEVGCIKPSGWGLDDKKKTILYAPTFYPSSIECLPKNFPEEFNEYNLIIKPHYFSLANVKYRNQKRLLELWGRAENVYLAGLDDVNIIPFMAVADVLISDASSTLFEFTALNKPVVWCDFYKLRWGYRGLLKFRFNRRMDEDLYRYADIAIHAKAYRELRVCVESQVRSPGAFSQRRQYFTLDLAGKVDGQCSERIVDYILSGR